MTGAFKRMCSTLLARSILLFVVYSERGSGVGQPQAPAATVSMPGRGGGATVTGAQAQLTGRSSNDGANSGDTYLAITRVWDLI